MERTGTIFGLTGSFVLAIYGALPAIALFAVSSTLLLITAIKNKQTNFVVLQSGFLFCNVLGLIKTWL